MEIVTCKDTQDLVERTHRWVEMKVKKYSAKRLFLPAGKTPEALYAKWVEERPSFLSNLTFVQVDDVATGRQQGIFKNFFEQHLASYVTQIEFIDEGQLQGADLGILGFGVNGHVAFHEPEFHDSFLNACVKLSGTTRSNLDLSEADWGITYGVGAFMQTKSLLLMVSGAKKEQSFQHWLGDNFEGPTALLKSHRDFTVFRLV